MEMYCVFTEVGIKFLNTGNSQLSGGGLTGLWITMAFSPLTKYDVLQRIREHACEPSLVCLYSMTATC
jgi:hypothetical protein